MVNSARMTGECFDLKPGNKALLCLSADYIAGKMMLVRAIVLELDLVSVEPTSIPLESLSDVDLAFAAMVPLQVSQSIANHPKALNRIDKLIIGGGAVSAQLNKRLQPLRTACFSTYGMTETITHVAIQPLNGERKSPYFHSLPGVKIWQDDRQCLTLEAPHLNPEKIITNDVVELEGFKEFRWLGRYDNVINSGGIKLHPEHIEKALESLLDRRYFVAGIPDETLENALVLVLESDPLDTHTLGLLNNTLREELERFEVPKQVLTTPSFLETETGKIRRQATLAQALSNRS